MQNLQNRVFQAKKFKIANLWAKIWKIVIFGAKIVLFLCKICKIHFLMQKSSKLPILAQKYETIFKYLRQKITFFCIFATKSYIFCIFAPKNYNFGMCQKMVKKFRQIEKTILPKKLCHLHFTNFCFCYDVILRKNDRQYAKNSKMLSCRTCPDQTTNENQWSRHNPILNA